MILLNRQQMWVNMNMAKSITLDMKKMQEVLTDQGWEGPDVVYLLCRHHHPRSGTTDEPEFIARVTPDPAWAIQRWRMSSYIQFTTVPSTGKSLYYVVGEIDETEFGLHVSFGTFPVYDIHGSEMIGFD
jgi:hypothetical protein